MSTMGGDIKLLGLHEYNRACDPFGLYNKDFISKIPRNTAYLACNPWKHNLLAQGIDRKRAVRDPSILIWDVTKCTEGRSDTHINCKTARSNSDLFVSTASDGSGSSEHTGATKIHQTFAPSGTPSSTLNHDGICCDRWLCDVGSQEVTSSFAWLTKSSFIAGMSGTYLKVFDLSDPSKPCQSTPTRAVNGLTVDPFCSGRIASFFEGQVSIWKSDILERPVYTIKEQSDILQIKWSPSREAWLGVLLEESVSVKLYDTYPMFSQAIEESELTSLEHVVFPSGKSPTHLVAFSWHPGVSDCLLTVDCDGCLDIAQLMERTAIAWSPEHALLWTHAGHWSSHGLSGWKSSLPLSDYMQHQNGLTVLDVHNHEHHHPYEGGLTGVSLPNGPVYGHMPAGANLLYQCLSTDIALVMQQRADRGYGVASDLAAYIGLLPEESSVRAMWIWIRYMQEYFSEAGARFRGHDPESISRSNGSKETMARFGRFCGVSDILSIDANRLDMSPSVALVNMDWRGIEARLPFPQYKSPERSHILRLCMWPLDDTEEVQRRVFEGVCADGQHGRAATMALINLNFNWALSFLNRDADANESKPPSSGVVYSTISRSEAGLVALALAGFTDSSNELWRNSCANLLKQLRNPYLRVMFTFLTRKGGDFDLIVNDEQLYLSDRVAFACLYLSDAELFQFVRSTRDILVQLGRLEAILLTGLTSPGFIQLVQTYVDRTADVQTGAIVGLHACNLSGPSRPPGSIVETAITRRADLYTGSGGGGGLRPTTGLAPNNRGTSSTGAGERDLSATLIEHGGVRIAAWVQCYRDLLDRWRMWFARADFDTANKVSLITDRFAVKRSQPTTTSNVASSPPQANPADQSPVTPENPIPGSNAFKLPAAPTVTGTEGGAAPSVLTASTPRSTNRVRPVGLVAPVNQVFVACGFCGARIGYPVRSNMAGAKTRPMSAASARTSPSVDGAIMSPRGGGMSINESAGKLTICPRCRKPLPRCAICLMHLGAEALPLTDSTGLGAAAATRREQQLLRCSTISVLPWLTEGLARVLQLNVAGAEATLAPANGIGSALMEPGGNQLMRMPKQSSSQTTATIPSAMASLFIWCQACRHGGHASHLIDWFYSPISSTGRVVGDVMGPARTCPVSGCSCRCASLDCLRPITTASPTSAYMAASLGGVCGQTTAQGHCSTLHTGNNAPSDVSGDSQSASVSSGDEDDDNEGADGIGGNANVVGLDEIVLHAALSTWPAAAHNPCGQ